MGDRYQCDTCFRVYDVPCHDFTMPTNALPIAVHICKACVDHIASTGADAEEAALSRAVVEASLALDSAMNAEPGGTADQMYEAYEVQFHRACAALAAFRERGTKT